MAGPRVVILYEDKTGGGLHRLVSSMVKKYRLEAGREPFGYFRDLAMKNNSKLVSECSSFERMRFFGPHRADHVIAVIDAYEVEKVVPKAPGPLGPSLRDDPVAFDLYCQRLDDAVREHLRERAFASMTAEVRDREFDRFHPHVLFWERESVFLAGGEILRETKKLRFPDEKITFEGIQKTRCPTAVVESAWMACSGSKYSKQINGPALFEDLVQADSRWPSLRKRLPSLSGIVQTLVDL